MSKKIVNKKISRTGILFSEERKKKIFKLLEENEKVLVYDLVEMFKVSDTTIRRDLDELQYEGKIIRTHGGALLRDNSVLEISVNKRKLINLEEKISIAKVAVKMINNGDSILMGGGSTTLELAKILNNFRNLRVITNSLDIAFELSKREDIELIVTGGILRKRGYTLTGLRVINYLNDINVDKLFISSNGVDIKKGLTSPSPLEAPIISKMIEVSKLKCLLVDSSKFGQIFFKKIAPIVSVDKIITDSKLDSKIIEEIKNLEVEVLVA